MKTISAILFLCCAVYSSAQSNASATPFDAPSPQLIASAAFPIPIESRRSNFIAENPPKAAEGRPANRGFLLLATLSAAATIADIELTANCLRTVPNCREGNSILGSDPSRSRLYGVNVPIYVGQVMLSRVLRRKFPERKAWTVPFLSSTGTHVVGIASNLGVR